MDVLARLLLPHLAFQLTAAWPSLRALLVFSRLHHLQQQKKKKRLQQNESEIRSKSSVCGGVPRPPTGHHSLPRAGLTVLPHHNGNILLLRRRWAAGGGMKDSPAWRERSSSWRTRGLTGQRLVAERGRGALQLLSSGDAHVNSREMMRSAAAVHTCDTGNTEMFRERISLQTLVISFREHQAVSEL